MNATFSLDDVTVVCVTYNSSAVVAAMAEALQPFGNVTIIDNGSSDDTAARVSALIRHAQLITRDSNAGFGAANNQAMATVATPFALLLNPDCVITPDDVQRLLDCMAHYPDAGVVGPQNWRSEGVRQISHRNAFFKPKADDLDQVPEQVIKVEWIHGCCQLIRTSAFRQIGGFDEAFFLYYEDDDLCLRMARAGYQCLFQPAANAMHKGGASSSSSLRVDFIKRFHYARSRQIAIRRYVSERAGRLHSARLIIAMLPAMLVYSLLLRRRDVIKWAAWGSAALCSLLGLDLKPGSGNSPAASTKA